MPPPAPSLLSVAVTREHFLNVFSSQTCVAGFSVARHEASFGGCVSFLWPLLTNHHKHGGLKQQTYFLLTVQRTGR